MFDTCVSCLHCKRLPQNVTKYANVTHTALAQNTSADVLRGQKLHFPEPHCGWKPDYSAELKF